MPPAARETGVVKRIADELQELAAGLRSYPLGEAGPRSASSASAILTSLKRVNATIAAGAEKAHLGPAGFGALGREFSKIGTTLSSLGSPTKSTARKAVKRTSTRSATKRTATKRKRTR